MKLLKLFPIYLFIFILLAIYLGFVGYSFISDQFQSPNQEAIKQEILVEPGQNTRKIATLLAEKNLIKNPLAFRLYIRFLAVDNQLKPGFYAFNGKESMSEVVKLLLKGNVVTVSVTIPEGVSVKRIAEIIHDAQVCNINEFIEACQNPSTIGRIFANWRFIPEIEGLLFPDTYFFSKNSSPEMVVERMLRMTEHQIKRTFTKPLPQGLTQYEGCVLASIIESEAAIDKERDIIASVFYNRLARKQKLESCATVLYAIESTKGIRKKRLLYEDLKIDSLFNTYIHQGLPPTPISNFGASSLKAVANPAKTDYLYFVSDNEGGHKFSKTLAEHNRFSNQFFNKRKGK